MIPDKEILDKIRFLSENYQNIPIKEWVVTETNNERKVIWILNRQKPSIEQDYSYDEERLGITHEGKIIFGFDSGCSCPVPWDDCGDSVYTEKTWKQLEVDIKDLESFDYFEDEDRKRLDYLINLIKEKTQ
jgi:ribosomal protein L39E